MQINNSKWELNNANINVQNQASHELSKTRVQKNYHKLANLNQINKSNINKEMKNFAL